MRFLLLILALCSQALAVTYYVDYDAGSDANNGTSTGTPFKRCPGMATATGNAAITLQSGDVVNFKGGVTHILDASISCEPGVTYDGNAWGTGVAILDGQNTTGNGFVLGATDNNVIIRDLQIQNIGGYAEDNPIFSGIEISSVDIGTDVFTSSADHGLVIGDDVQFTTTGTFPGGFTGGKSSLVKYYVISTPTSTTFTLSATLGGVLKDATSTGSGTIKVWEPVTAPAGGIGINAGSGNDNLTVANVIFTEIGQWQNVPPMSGTGSVTGQGINLQGNIGVSITGCTLSKMHNPIAIKVNGSTGGIVDDILVDNCEITHCVWGIDITPRSSGTTLSDITISNSAIHSLNMYDSGNWLGFGEKPHTDLIFARVNYASTWTNLRIHGCEFYSNNPGSTPGGTAAIYLSAGASALLYNNVFYNVRTTRTIEITPLVQSTNKQVVRIYNNLFYQGGIQILTDYETNPDKKELHIQNNIFVRDGLENSLMIARNNASLDPNTMNNNLYFANTFTEAQKQLFKLNFTGSRLADARAAGFELNGAWGNPLLLDTLGDYDDANLRIGTGSAGIGLGANLSAYFTTDKDGNARPASGAWDVGPYVYDASPPADTTAPTLTSAGVDSEGDTVILTFSEPVQNINLAHYAISGHSLSGLTGSGTTWAFTISPIRQSGANFSMTYTSGAGRTADIAGNMFASGTYTVTNGSLAATPDPAKPGRRGGGAKRLLRR
jgi:hypothetical protein